jgi:hypothetical protein
LQSGDEKHVSTPQKIREKAALVVLGSWGIWKHKNACVFEEANPSVSVLLRCFEDERHLWCFAGAHKLGALGPVVEEV